MNDEQTSPAGGGKTKPPKPAKPAMAISIWLEQAREPLEAAALNLKEVLEIEKPPHDDNRLAFQAEILREEVIDIYTRIGDLYERADIEVTKKP